MKNKKKTRIEVSQEFKDMALRKAKARDFSLNKYIEILLFDFATMSVQNPSNPCKMERNKGIDLYISLDVWQMVQERMEGRSLRYIIYNLVMNDLV